MANRVPVPRQSDDYTREAAEARRDFLEEHAGTSLEHVGSYSLDPSVLPGNIEHFTGVAQVPLGIAGPLLVDGEHAQGEFYVPMATAEGTLVASYNRGMKLLHAAGGVKTTIMDDRMQRAPAFLFESAREARAFGEWLDEHFDAIREVAESTTKSGRLQDIEQYSASRILYTRFNYTTGDAAGQNMTGKATQAACHWILEQYPDIDQFFLEGNFATDKKSSQINMLRTRGKRVVAEATIPDALFQEVMNSSSALMYRARQVSNLGGFMSGVNNNGAHSANGITAMFIATGQDVANVAESSAAFTYAELRENGDYYYSLTIPSLIVGTYGGGTGLATQRECLELLGLLRRRRRAQVHRDRGRDRAVRRAVAGLGDRGGGVGQRPRPPRPQPALERAPDRVERTPDGQRRRPGAKHGHDRELERRVERDELDVAVGLVVDGPDRDRRAAGDVGKPVAADHGRDRPLDVDAGQQLLHASRPGRALRPDQHALAAEVGERHRAAPAGEAVVARDGEPRGRAAQRQHVTARTRLREARQHEVGGPVAQLRADRRRPRLDEIELHAGQRAAQRVEDPLDLALAEARRHAEHERLRRRAAELARAGDRGLGRRDQRLGVGGQRGARRGRLDAVRRALHQRDAELGLEPRHRAAHGLLGDVQLARGLREGPVADDGGEHGEGAEVSHNDRL